MTFRFPLATLLRLREIAELREERLLEQILAQIAEGRRTLVDLAERRLLLIQQRERSLQSSTSASNLTDSYVHVRAVERMEKDGREQVAKLLALRDQQMKIYEAAHRDRDLLSDMRLGQKEAFQKVRTRQEQNAMDDSFGSRRNLN